MIEIFNDIARRQTINIMKHVQLADMFDFLNLYGEKMQQEYHAREEWTALRNIHSYAINNLYRLIDDRQIQAPALIHPASWFSATKKEVTNDIRRQYIKSAYDEWQRWEAETKDFYETCFRKLLDNGKISESNEVNRLIYDVTEELKKLNRELLEYKSVDFSLEYILQKQEEKHHKYKKLCF